MRSHPVPVHSSLSAGSHRHRTERDRRGAQGNGMEALHCYGIPSAFPEWDDRGISEAIKGKGVIKYPALLSYRGDIDLQT